jgi:hypothetical protein
MTYQKSKDIRRQEWLAACERRVVELNPSMRGKMDWNTAIHLFNSGETAVEAAEKIAKL